MPAYLGAHLARVLHDESFEHFCGWTHAKARSAVAEWETRR